MPAYGLEGSVDMYMVEWDFARDGGGVGAIAFRGPQLPKGFRITSTFLETLTGIAGGGSATIAIHAVSANDILSQVVLTNFAAAGCDAGIQVGVAANSLLMTADSTVYLTVGTAALTAGKMRVVFYGYHTDS
jgi:hypothetical protein